MKTFELVAQNPGYILVENDSAWVADWSSPDVVRLPAVGKRSPDDIVLPVADFNVAVGVTTLAAGAGAIWATVPGDHAGGGSTRRRTRRRESRCDTPRGASP